MILNENENTFREKTALVAADSEYQQILDGNLSRLNDDIQDTEHHYDNLELAKRRASNIRAKGIDNLEKNLIDFESNFLRRGGKVIWSLDSKEAVNEILNILKRNYFQKVLKSKSNLIEEMGLKKPILGNGIDLIETDYADYINSVDGNFARHPVFSAINRSREEIIKSLSSKLDINESSLVEEIVEKLALHLKKEYIESDVSIMGANFLVAETGTVAISENQGNVLLQTAFPKVQIIVASIDKIIPNFNDLDVLLPLLSTYSTGQFFSTYNILINGPKQDDELEGPEEVYVVIMDNKRSELLDKQEQRRALSCIKCGACYNVCPIYKVIGGNAYDVLYGGPIGSVVTPFLTDFESQKHLSFTSTLCGKCTDVCPVKIPIHKLLYYNRRDSVEQGMVTKRDLFLMNSYKRVMKNRKYMDIFKSGIKNFVVKKVVKDDWVFPAFADKSFNKMQRDLLKGDERLK